MSYFSQSKQDEFLDKYIFRDINDGFFIEIGAYDGLTYSNTLYFEKSKNWKGICVEPIPSIFEKLKKNRTCECIQGCIYKSKGEIELTHIDGQSEMLTGITVNHNNLHKNRIENEINKFGGEIKIHKVKTYKLTDILNDRKISHVNYCSIDVEGSELDVLNSIDFSQITFDVLTIENNYKDEKIDKYLAENDYICIGYLEADQIYVSNKRDDITKLKLLCNYVNFRIKISNFMKKIFA